MQWLSYQGSTLVDERKKKKSIFNVRCFCRDMLDASGEKYEAKATLAS